MADVVSMAGVDWYQQRMCDSVCVYVKRSVVLVCCSSFNVVGSFVR